ncbi:putative cell surface protein [Aspergillus lucknowensis]|uniref:GPI anchored protein n=1 Tax=Aspergillus lucknowensis TaxID=176173 RepID=A0ABR4L878_9EURO
MKPTVLSTCLPLLILSTSVSARTDLIDRTPPATTCQQHEGPVTWSVPGGGDGHVPQSPDKPASTSHTGTATYEPCYFNGHDPGSAAITVTARATAVAATEETDTSSADADTDSVSVYPSRSGASLDWGSITISSTAIPGEVTSEHGPGSTVGTSGNAASRVTPSSVLHSPTSNLGNATYTGGGNAVGMLGCNAGFGAVGLLAALML